jgi:hypothetical protein
MQRIVNGDEVPDADRLRALLDEAGAHRQEVVRKQYERITGETPDETNPEDIVSSLSTWLFARDESSKETADRVTVEFESVNIADLTELLERAWNGDTFSEAEIVDPTVVQQARRYDDARRLLEENVGDRSLWSQLREASNRLEEEYPTHPVTTEVQETLGRSQPPTVDEVETLIAKSEDPFEVDERLEELAGELQTEHPDHELTATVVDAVEQDTPPSDQCVAELIEKAEELLAGVDEQMKQIRETMDDLGDGSVVLIESLD